MSLMGKGSDAGSSKIVPLFKNKINAFNYFVIDVQNCRLG